MSEKKVETQEAQGIVNLMKDKYELMNKIAEEEDIAEGAVIRAVNYRQQLDYIERVIKDLAVSKSKTKKTQPEVKIIDLK